MKSSPRRAELDSPTDDVSGTRRREPEIEIDLSSVPATIAELPTLRRFAGYELLGRVAVGGMAEIFLARERSGAGSTRLVALKVVRPELAADRELTELFLREGKVALGLRHPSVCHVYEFGVEQGHPFLAMELVTGVTVRELVTRARRSGAPIPAPIAAKIASSVAEALHSAHVAQDERGRSLGIVHQDVSPHNVMVAYDGTVKLLDFGVATTTSERDVEAEKSHITVRGKAGYLSPEQCRGVPVDARSDVFSLGVVLYEMLTGSRLFARASRVEGIRAIVSEPLPEWPASIPEALRRVLDAALARDREQRLPTAAALQEELERYLVDARTHVTSAKIAAVVARVLGDDFGAPPKIDASPEVVAWLGEVPEAIAIPATVSATVSAPLAPRTARRHTLWGVAALVALALAACGAAIATSMIPAPMAEVAPLAPRDAASAPPSTGRSEDHASPAPAGEVAADRSAEARAEVAAPPIEAEAPPSARPRTRAIAPALSRTTSITTSATETEESDFVDDPGF